MKVSKTSVASVMVATVLATQASAALIPLVNSSFEEASGGNNPTGWVRTATSPFSVRSYVEGSGFTTPFTAPGDGNRYIGVGPMTTVTSTTTYTILASDVGSVVTATVAMGTRLRTSPDILWSTAAANHRVGILVNNALVSSAVLPSLPAIGTFADLSTTYIIQASDIGAPMNVQFTNLNGVGGPNWDQAGSRVHADNVRLDVTAVPEPASLGLLALGGLVLAGRRRIA